MTLEGDLSDIPQTYTMVPNVWGKRGVHFIHEGTGGDRRGRFQKGRAGPAWQERWYTHSLEQSMRCHRRSRDEKGPTQEAAAPGQVPVVSSPTHSARDRHQAP